MKRILIAVLGVGIVIGTGAYIYFDLGTQKYEKPEVIVNEVEIEKEVFSKDIRVKAAQDAMRSEIELEADAAYKASYENAMQKIRAEVLEEMEAEFNAERIQVEKEIGVY